ncbi:MAG: SDR family oxidoreductase [Erysipelotrichaceae bacterium]|nr:SDR family oxidoreductase [Erysipelotrichaceae bacterium]
MRAVLVTGASGGIGKEFARQFAYRGYNLLLAARREEVLAKIKEEFEEEYKIRVEILACDLAKDPKAVYDYCHEKGIEVSVLVNNAGYGDYKKFVDADLDKLLGMIDLNNKALVALTHYFVKDMKEMGYGHIINVGSVASFMPGPYMAVYYASKAFVMSFSLALREELKKDSIKVSVLCPGPTNSDFWSVADGKDTAMNTSAFTRTPIDAAKTGYALFESGKAFAIDGALNKLMIAAVRFMPLELAARAVGLVQKTVKGKGD